MANFRLGSGWMVVAALFFALMGLFVKLGAEYFSSTELVFWRTLIGVLALGCAALWRRERFATPLLRYHLQRGVIGYASLLMSFYAIAHLPLATASTLTYTSPMFLALLSVVLLREKLPARAMMGLALGFVGVVLLLRPTLSGEVLVCRSDGAGVGFSGRLVLSACARAGQARRGGMAGCVLFRADFQRGRLAVDVF
ncbi:DMT family transporter [Chromobacterium sp. IIBBL 290-4]|uniref:DMT family transporter n=1 Tax=Chromobacterium sp. IIBBL 290-4 TaxID=2953890 RepID=UPI003531B868